MSADPAELVYANGIDATTGDYLLPPMTPAQIAAVFAGETTDEQRVAELAKVASASSAHLGLPRGVDENDIAQAGWGVVFSRDEKPEVKEALEPLLALRREQVSDASRYRELDYVTGELKTKWLNRHDVAVGSIDPTCVPLYLLVVGCPSLIPFGFCQELAGEYAVGLLSFETPAEYAAYAATVVNVEKREIEPRQRRLTFFATRHPFDGATQLSADGLVKPLAEGDLATKYGCRFESVWGDAATHEALTGVLTRKDATAPGFLFTAGHGMGFPPGHADQRAGQGALICQDWAGAKAGPVQRGQYFAAADVPDEANVAGLFAFVFACFGGGTPARDRFSHAPGEQPPELAPEPFAAALPQRLLAHPGGGALGCIAHVERAWGCSITSAGRAVGPKLDPFVYAIETALGGFRIGLALRDFNDRLTNLSTSLAAKLEKIGYGASYPDAELAGDWIARNDAEGYALFGDPAARLQLESAA